MKAYTPWKINMEPTNLPFRKEHDLPKPLWISSSGVSPFSLAEWFFWVNFQGSKVSESSWWSMPPKSCLIHPQLAAAFKTSDVIPLYWSSFAGIVGSWLVYRDLYIGLWNNPYYNLITYTHLEVGSIWNNQPGVFLLRFSDSKKPTYEVPSGP